VKFVPETPTTPEKISILVVSSHAEDLTSLRNILNHRDWKISHCASVHDACEHMQNDATETCVVVTESSLPDGTWKDLLHAADARQQPPLVLVTSRHADDRLWGEVLNLGGYDVLLKPFDRSEVVRVIGMAWRCWVGAFRRSRTPRPQLASHFA
jgi:DNA-binding NtrC family response regulator